MKARKGFTLIELLVVISIIAILAAILFPVFAKARKAAQNANCESNMKQIGTAIKMYLPDWDDTYPTNRYVDGTLREDVAIMPPPPATSTTPLQIDKYGVPWVEALYKYTEQASASGDPVSVWRCQAASTKTDHTGTTVSNYSLVTYAFNYNLVENVEGVIKGADHLMMVRELDRLCRSRLRPSNYSTSDPNTVPQDPFLTTTDILIAAGAQAPTQSGLHYNGSHILFADGHVKLFTTAYMPAGDQGDPTTPYTTAHCWNSDTSQWFNYNRFATKVPVQMRESIAISP